MVEDVACIRGALDGPREDAADAVHVHHGITAKVLAYVRGKCNGRSTMKHMQSVLKTEHNVPDRDMQKLRQAQLVKMVSLTALCFGSEPDSESVRRC